MDGPAAAIKLQFMFGLITGKKCDREGSAYSLTHANGCYNQQPPASRLCENQAHTQHHSDHLVFAGTPPTTLLKSDSYLISSNFKGEKRIILF